MFICRISSDLVFFLIKQDKININLFYSLFVHQKYDYSPRTSSIIVGVVYDMSIVLVPFIGLIIVKNKFIFILSCFIKKKTRSEEIPLKMTLPRLSNCNYFILNFFSYEQSNWQKKVITHIYYII
jgi:hypothetical protein